MPENEKHNHNHTNEVSKRVVTEHHHSHEVMDKSGKRPLVIGGLVLVAVLIFLALAIGSYFSSWRKNYLYPNHSQTITTFDDHGWGMRGMMTITTNGGTSDTTTTTSYTRTDGVITAVGTNSFTVAGHGEKITVKTDDSTIFNGASLPVKVNDSVIVVGTKDGNNLTANSVYTVRN